MGQSPPGSTYNEIGEGLPFLQGSAEFGTHFPKPVRYCSAPSRVAESGDLLVSVRAPVGDTNFADQQLAFGRGLAAIRGSDEAMTAFIRLVLQDQTMRLNRAAAGGVFTSITAKNLKGFLISLPPIEEQQHIVDIIDGVDEMLQATQTTTTRTHTARQAVLSDLLSGEHEIPDSYDDLLESV